MKTNLFENLLIEGKAKFTDDIIEPPNTLYASLVRAPFVGQIKDIKLPKGEYIYLDEKDIPDKKYIGEVAKDVPIFPDEAHYVGEIIGCVLAKDKKTAKEIKEKVVIEGIKGEAIKDADEALEKGFSIGTPLVVKNGVLRFSQNDTIFNGQFEVGFQEHFYLEPQSVLVVPLEGKKLKIYCTTQHPVSVQENVADVLGIDVKDVEVEVLRLGGAFGGKEESPTILAVIASIGTYKTGKPVRLTLTREEDAAFTGKRHAYKNEWQVRVSKGGKIKGIDIKFKSNGGYYADLSIPVIERTLLNAEGIYRIPYVNFKGLVAKTNLPPSTAFRGFGTPQAALMIEYIMDYIADKTKIDRLKIRELNFYKKGNKTPYGQTINDFNMYDIFNQMNIEKLWKETQKEVKEFNSSNKYKKMGTGFIPVKYGIAFTSKFLNQGYAFLHLHKDGSVSVATGGVEMGQGITIKMANIVNNILGIPIDRINVMPNKTAIIAHSSPTAASSAVDLNGQALKVAIKKIKRNADSFCMKKYGNKSEWNNNMVQCGKNVFTVKEFVNLLYKERISLSALGHWRTPGLSLNNEKMKGKAFSYFVYGAAFVVSIVDMLTGEIRLKKVKIVHDAGKSFNESVDKGQIIGAFMQGSGYLLWEEVFYDKNGLNRSNNASTYKIPTINEVPNIFEVELLQNSKSDYGVLASKGIGEPPFLYGIASYLSVLNAMKHYSGEFAEVFPPLTAEKIIMYGSKYE